jgi:hypothetical protein
MKTFQPGVTIPRTRTPTHQGLDAERQGDFLQNGAARAERPEGVRSDKGRRRVQRAKGLGVPAGEMGNEAVEADVRAGARGALVVPTVADEAEMDEGRARDGAPDPDAEQGRVASILHASVSDGKRSEVGQGWKFGWRAELLGLDQESRKA